MFGADPEEADNMELGVRYSEGTSNMEVFYFASDYSRLAAECTLVSGAACDADESAIFSGGEAEVTGLELNGSVVFQGDGVTYPVSISWTNTDATGDDLPYIPNKQSSVVAGFITDNGLSGSARWVNVGSSCSLAACGAYNKIESHSYLDLSLRKAINDSMDVYVILENTTDQADLISRAPSEGARSQKPRTMKLGFTYSF